MKQPDTVCTNLIKVHHHKWRRVHTIKDECSVGKWEGLHTALGSCTFAHAHMLLECKVCFAHGATAPASSKKSSSHGCQAGGGFSALELQIKRSAEEAKTSSSQKPHYIVHDRADHLQVPLLEDHHRETEETAAGSCSDSDEAGDSEDGSYNKYSNNYSNNESRSSASSVKTLESSFTAEDRSARPCIYTGKSRYHHKLGNSCGRLYAGRVCE